ncbi:hypothetical protein [Natronococcus sp. A-GB7]|uniref:hypothetical protein n=1 Tax=Natronococcus sp. A-GB7 TaxID=3037649 RepID=UPI00241D89BE|nr:hypothetical protein [Natronococcus sp. A-GB7]MDG5821309.1 hypothetical protein [Natronococcus sp. A-GB7]
MPHTVVVNGAEITVGEQTTVATLQEIADVPQEATAFFRANDVIYLLHDTETIAERVPDEATIGFYRGQIGPETDLEADNGGRSGTDDSGE